MIPRFDDNTECLNTDWLYDDFDRICEDFAKMQEQMIFKDLKDSKSIEDAVLIMNPKHKEIVIKSGLKCCILWSSLCPEDKTYMVTDEQLKAYLRGMIDYV